jgi:hypothetical protein
MGARICCWRSGATRLLAGAAVAATLLGGAAAAQQSVVFEGSTFVNQGLVGVARVPSDARDQFGDTLGGFGSAMAMDLNSWKKNRDGSYTGPFSWCRTAAGTPRARSISAAACIAST